MIKRISAALMLLLGMSMQLAYGSPTNLVVNGDFEAGNLNGWTLAPDPAPNAVQFAGTDNSFSPSPHGGKVFSDAAYNQVGFISQNLVTTAGATYKLEFDLQRFDTSGGDVDNFASVSFAGITLMMAEDVGADWIHFTFTNIAGTGVSSKLEFGNRNYWDFNQLDNILLVQTSEPPPTDPADPGTVPEPGSMVLVLAGLGLLYRVRRNAGLGGGHV